MILHRCLIQEWCYEVPRLLWSDWLLALVQSALLNRQRHYILSLKNKSWRGRYKKNSNTGCKWDGLRVHVGTRFFFLSWPFLSPFYISLLLQVFNFLHRRDSAPFLFGVSLWSCDDSTSVKELVQMYFEWRTSIESEFFAFLGSGFGQTLERIGSIRVKTLSSKNEVASRTVKTVNSSISVTVRG